MFHLSKTHRLGLMILMVLIYFVVELVVGHMCDSVTLVADSFHMLSDVLALIVALGAVRMSKKPRDGRHTYGFQRAEIIGTLVNTVMLLTLCFTIIVEAIEKLIDPHVLKDPKLVIYVGSGGLLINLIGILLFCGHSHGHSHLDEGHDAQQLRQRMSIVVNPDEETLPMQVGSPSHKKEHKHEHRHKHKHEHKHKHGHGGDVLAGGSGGEGAPDGEPRVEIAVGPQTELLQRNGRLHDSHEHQHDHDIEGNQRSKG